MPGSRLHTLLALVALGAGGCREERIVSASGLLVGLPGAETSLPTENNAKYIPALAVPDGGIRQEIDEDTIVLHAKTVQHLLTHIVHAIQHAEEDLFVSQ
ncbi:MAG: hypothetical protein AAGA55_11285, partial [Planctomycetota bacterium]